MDSEVDVLLRRIVRILDRLVWDVLFTQVVILAGLVGLLWGLVEGWWRGV